jgi:quercetin dioxygenase-like cupin family protein
MGIEVRRFGVGNRRPHGPKGTVRVEGQPILVDERGAITELALAPDARLEPHSSPNEAWFIVIEGGGFVLVGDERRRVAAGEAILWPAGTVHGAWTEHSPMRAIVVEFHGAGEVLAGTARALGPGEAAGVPAEGALADHPLDPADADRSTGEPL